MAPKRQDTMLYFGLVIILALAKVNQASGCSSKVRIHPQNANVTIGDVITLTCKFDPPLKECVWKKNGTVVSIQGRYSYLDSNRNRTGNCSIGINGVTSFDDDIWLCSSKATENCDATHSSTSVVTVIIPQAPFPISNIPPCKAAIKIHPINISATVGQDVTLKCEFSETVSECSWEKNDEVYSMQDRFSYLESNGKNTTKCTLKISRTVQSDSGKWICASKGGSECEGHKSEVATVTIILDSSVSENYKKFFTPLMYGIGSIILGVVIIAIGLIVCLCTRRKKMSNRCGSTKTLETTASGSSAKNAVSSMELSCIQDHLYGNIGMVHEENMKQSTPLDKTHLDPQTQFGQATQAKPFSRSEVMTKTSANDSDLLYEDINKSRNDDDVQMEKNLFDSEKSGSILTLCKKLLDSDTTLKDNELLEGKSWNFKEEVKGSTNDQSHRPKLQKTITLELKVHYNQTESLPEDIVESPDFHEEMVENTVYAASNTILSPDLYVSVSDIKAKKKLKNAGKILQ